MTRFKHTSATYEPGARTMPQDFYTSATILEHEREKIFSTHWLCVGRAEHIAEPGQYVLFERFGESVIVVRDRSGASRAFYNVCRHRGTRICEKAEGKFSGSIQCPYHAWTWSTDGRCIGAPHMQEIEGFSKGDYPLLSLPLKEWEGFLFVNFSVEPPPFDQAFAPVMDRFARFNLPGLRRIERREYEVRSNWKLIMQNYNECLHCPTIHPELNALLPYTSGANDLFDGGFLGGYMEITPPNVSVTMTGRACGLPIGDLDADDMRRAFYYTLFPNMMLSVHSDYVNWYTVWPLAPDRSLIVTEWMMHPGSPASPHYDPQAAIDIWHVTNSQDWHICEQSQLGISSRAYIPGPYSPRESVPAAWDRWYRARLGL